MVMETLRTCKCIGYGFRLSFFFVIMIGVGQMDNKTRRKFRGIPIHTLVKLVKKKSGNVLWQ